MSDENEPENEQEPVEEVEEVTEIESIEDIDGPELVLSPEEESFKDKYLRTRADLENIQRRMREERNSLRVNSIANFSKELLPFIDNLDRAIAAAEEDNELLKGLKMSREQLEQIFQANNIKVIDCSGLFDGKLHEAVASIENLELPNNSITAVLEIGYILGDRVIRYSKVQVSTGGD
jgi:molecular chaperone GrpE